MAGALSEFGAVPRRAAAFAAAVLSRFERAYALLESGREAELLDRYRSRLCCIGRPVTVITPPESTGPTAPVLTETDICSSVTRRRRAHAVLR